MLDILRKIFPSANQRRISEYTKIVNKINALEEEMSSKDEIFFKELHFDEKPDEEKFSHIFASVREASVRTLGLRHFDCQMIGGLVLKDGNIAEMKTGEGKTLVATLPAVLNALNGKKVYVVTVNDYLAERDAAWMAPIYEYFGLKVSALTSTQSFEEKKSSYESNIIYCTSSELGFDYLRDNMVLFRNQKSQADLNFAIIDEVDSILIDEARTPLIISGATDDDASAYPVFLKLIPNLKQQLREGTDEEPLSEEEKGDFLIDEKGRSVELTENGFEKVENFLVNRNMIKEDESLYTTNNLKFLKYIQATLKANYLFEKDVHYVKEGNKVVLIDDNTGRKLPGRRISEGVHQALECKEKVPIQQETQTLASTTFQNYFRLFDQISGMTGTADTEAAEFKQIYNMSVVVIPTNQTMVREDVNDVVYVNEEDKYSALLTEIKEINKKEAPILVGTASIESSEKVSSILKKAGIKHQVLNAKYHEKEAMIIEEAGRPGAITIATNMAGRGTDIVLGGKKENDKEWNKNHQKVIDAGGLHVIGTERHESRRIDNQLRGRSGRQGDPGYSKFFLSLDDTVLRLFIDENRKQLFSRLSEGMDDSSIEHPLLNGAIANAQKKIENRNFEIRKQILEYDDVSNDQRQAIYSLRNQLLEEDEISETINEMITFEFKRVTNQYIPLESVESQWKAKDLENFLSENYGLKTNIAATINDDKSLIPETINDLITEKAHSMYKEKYESLGDNRLMLEKEIMLQVLDVHWKEHLAEIDHLRGSIGLRAYAQKNPKNEFKQEAYSMFEMMLDEIDSETVRILFSIQFANEEMMANLKQPKQEEVVLEKPEAINEDLQSNQPASTSEEKQNPQTVTRDEPKYGRNEIVKITNGQETKELKYKKALSLIESGEWKII